jgi:hypothetical protein
MGPQQPVDHVLGQLQPRRRQHPGHGDGRHLHQRLLERRNRRGRGQRGLRPASTLKDPAGNPATGIKTVTIQLF